MLRQLPKITDPNLLVGVNAGDDAAVYRMDDELALIQTLDFFPPIVDDPFDFGRIAATNALSDVYATGARPILALAIVAMLGTGLQNVILAIVIVKISLCARVVRSNALAIRGASG